MMRPGDRFSWVGARLGGALLSNKGPQVARLIYELIHRMLSCFLSCSWPRTNAGRVN